MGLLKKIFFILLLLFLFGEIIRIDLGGGLIIKPLDIGVGTVAFAWLLIKLIKKEKIKFKQICLPIILFAGFGIFSLLINYSSLTVAQFFTSLMYPIRWMAYASIIFVVADFGVDFKNKITKLLLILGSVIIGLGYVQYFFYPSLKNLYYLGWDEHMFRMFSVFLDPNFAGTFFVLFFLFSVSIFLKKKSLFIGIISALALGGVFLTFSRSTLIMLIISSSLFFVLMNKKKIIVFLLLIILIVIGVSSRYFNIENINLFRIASSEARLETAKDAISIFKNNLVFGVGFNAYRYAQVRYGFRSGQPQIASHADAGTDNSFLFVMATTGLVGFTLYMFMWLRILKLNSTPLFVASAAGVFVDSLFINSLFYPLIMLWLWIVLALSIDKG